MNICNFMIILLNLNMLYFLRIVYIIHFAALVNKMSNTSNFFISKKMFSKNSENILCLFYLNAKDIGVLYLIYALFSGLVGTTFSVLIKLELLGSSVQYVADNQLYNSIITAHTIIMIFFMVILALIGFGRLLRTLKLIRYLKYAFKFISTSNIQNIYIFIILIYILISITCSICCFTYQFFGNMLLSSYVNEGHDWHTVMMDSGNNPGGNNSSGGGNGIGPGGGPGGGPNWQPHNYVDLPKENGSRNTPLPTPPSSVLNTYDPTGNIPPASDKQLGVLMDYRFAHNVRATGFNNWDVSHTFPSNSMVDRISRARLLNHIIKYKADIPSAFNQLDVSLDTPKWDRVRITSFLINSLNHSND